MRIFETLSGTIREPGLHRAIFSFCCFFVLCLFSYPNELEMSIVHVIGEDEQDKGMEMENDFEGEMFDVPKGEENDQDDKVGYHTFMFDI